MKIWLLVAISIWVTLHSAQAIDVFTLDLKNPTEGGYSEVLDGLRNRVRDPNLDYGHTGLPVVAAPTNQYLRVNLIGTKGTVSLALLTNDLYVKAYLTTDNKNKYHAYYFPESMTTSQIDKLFPEAKGRANQIELGYKENYATLERVAEKTRKDLGMGVKKLDSLITEVYGQRKRNIQNEARFLIESALMIPEATRSRYIQNKVLDTFSGGFTPDDHVLLLIRNWERLSEAIKSNPIRNGKFDTPIVLNSPEKEVKKPWTVKTVTELKVGILKNLGNASPHPMTAFEATNDGHSAAF